jgi:hypothetical protein
MTKAQIRLHLADALYDGPVPLETLHERCRQARYPLSLLASAAKSLGVEEIEREGRRCWRLPPKVIPFRRWPVGSVAA